ncbi:hypothetical protein [Gorillibacterium massiliense]|uniref:hypothetical protein n=1 Tax=Gorillibacterium massiliense TaxID=1280390 RepID=UPI0004B9C7EA|nr:hypothetical protein [Gorillibacterium massiliense]
MAAKREEYKNKLNELVEWDEFLRQQSGLPGPRANLELMYAAAEEGDEERFLGFLGYEENHPDGNSPDVFVLMCGIVGLGKLAAQDDRSYLKRLRAFAKDERWRVREGVSMALQLYGKSDIHGMLTEMNDWATGSLLERRAVVAALCEPALLKDRSAAERTVRLLDAITSSLVDEGNRRTEELRVLRQTLGYGWSVAIAACPVPGKELFFHWLTSSDPDIRWLVKENLSKSRLKKMDAEWVAECMRNLAS